MPCLRILKNSVNNSVSLSPLNCSSSSCGVAQGIESEVGEPPQDGSMAEGRVYGLRVKKGELRVAVIAKKSGGAALADASPAPVPI